MDRARALLGSGSAVASARLFSLVCAAVQLPLLTRYLSPGEYSAIAIAIAIATYFNLLSAEPVILGFERFPGSNAARFNYHYALMRTLGAVAVAGLVVALIAYPLGRTEEAVAFAGWGAGIAINRLVGLAWLMWERPWQYAWNLMAGTGVRTTVLLVLILTGWNPLLSLGAAGLASAAAALIISPRIDVAATTRKMRPWRFSFGINLALASFAFTALSNGNLLLLAMFAPSDLVGKYAVMMQVATLSSAAVLGLMLAVTYPPLRLAWDQGHHVSVRAHLVTLQLGCVFVASTTIFLAFVADHFFLKIILPEHFIDETVLAPLIMATAFATMGGIASWHHQLELDAGRVARGTAAAALGGILITLWLTSVYQERGAAIGAAVGFVIYLVTMRSGTNLPLLPTAVAIAALVLTSAALFVPSLSGDAVAYPALVVMVGAFLLTLRSLRSGKV